MISFEINSASADFHEYAENKTSLSSITIMHIPFCAKRLIRLSISHVGTPSQSIITDATHPNKQPKDIHARIALSKLFSVLTLLSLTSWKKKTSQSSGFVLLDMIEDERVRK